MNYPLAINQLSINFRSFLKSLKSLNYYFQVHSMNANKDIIFSIKIRKIFKLVHIINLNNIK